MGLADAEGDYGFVVEVFGSGLEDGDGFEDGGEGSVGGLGGGGMALEQGAEAIGAVHVAVDVFGVEDAVGEEDEEVAGLGLDGLLLVGDAGEEAEGEAFDGDGADVDGVGEIGVTGGDEEGLDGAGVGDAEGAIPIVPERDEHGDVLGGELAFLELLVERGEEVGGTEMPGGERAEDAADERRIKGGWSGLSADISDRDGEAAGVFGGAVVEEVVDVAADGAGGKEAGGDLGVGRLGWGGWKKSQLDLARHFEVALHALFLFVNALVEAGVGDGDGDLRGEGGEGALVVVVEVADAGVLEVDDADDVALVDEGDGQLGAGFGVFGDVAGIFADIRGENRGSLGGGGADEAMAGRDVALAGDALAVAGAEAMLEVFGASVPEQDGEHLEVDDALEELADALEEVVEVEDGGDLARDLVEDGEGLGLAGDAGVEAGIFDGGGHAGGDELKEALVLGGEEGGRLGLDVDDADDFVFDDEGNGELGADAGVGVDVVLDKAAVGEVDVFDEDGAALERGLSGDAAADLDAHALDFGGVAGLEAHPELVGAVVEEEDGEDAVVDDGADEVGDAVHEGVEVEGGVEGVGEAVEELDLEGLDVGLGGGGGWVVGPVVAFEGVLCLFSEGEVWRRGLLIRRRHGRADDTTARVREWVGRARSLSCRTGRLASSGSMRLGR